MFFSSEHVQVNVMEDGLYTFTSNCEMNTYGYLYRGKLDPLDPFKNIIASDDDGGCIKQFQLTAYLDKQTTYTLVVTTSHMTGCKLSWQCVRVFWENIRRRTCAN